MSFNSSCSDQQRKNVMSELHSSEPELRLLYTTPESLLKPALREALVEACASGTLCAFAIDEAHCISEWVSCLLSTPWPLVYAHDRLGHVRCVADVVNCDLSSVCDPDPCCLPACPSNIGVPSVPPALTLTPVQGHDFRPAYLQLASLKADFPGIPIAAITASATPRVQESIVRCLGLSKPQIIAASFNRPNIELTVRHKALLGAQGADDDVMEDLLRFIGNRPGQCGIIYARLRSTCDWLASVLSGCDLDVAKYHAGMDPDQRRKVLRDWTDGSVDIVVATIAFGMGIDRADVRWVVHWNLPGSVEGFYQEAGRAGRDGQPSLSLVYESQEDAEAVAKLERGNRQGAMASVVDLMAAPGCRRRRLLAHFAEARGACDAASELLCDFCADPQGVRRRLDERERRTHARAARERAREARRVAGGEESGSDGVEGEEGEGSGGGDGWGSAARLCTASVPPGAAVRQQQQQKQQQQQEAGVVLGDAEEEGCCAREQHQQQRRPQQQPDLAPRPALAPLGRGRYGNSGARPGTAFKAPTMVQPRATAAASHAILPAAAAPVSPGPAVAVAVGPNKIGWEDPQVGLIESNTTRSGLVHVSTASGRAPVVVPRLLKRFKGSQGCGVRPGSAGGCGAAAGAEGATRTGPAAAARIGQAAVATAVEAAVAAHSNQQQQQQQQGEEGHNHNQQLENNQQQQQQEQQQQQQQLPAMQQLHTRVLHTCMSTHAAAARRPFKPPLRR
ncbi:ATP-dependent DNA helicase RecQ [Monoraphidium neglectum]|uniref:DNA 3'-5' helicase n=1 Tax=Monoraphidium neglectum TaxID=145388 RepID=A0A0D2MPH3_9CHLO|nr:ATP-dependent DNA helicase RecQ [Monoraphidium neglectum]KIZ04575.1 ATP-dependent DNA helicase RecQ [Monoraphidium neglectum]|eukprot:XP_013903594.1 ATP-dependent DNA helicase RecQ [Monoraphidium neglectum]